MNVLQKLRLLYVFYRDSKKLLKEEGMKELIASAAGWLKIIAYAASIAGLLMGWISPTLALEISLIVSAVVKLVQEITKITPSQKDDAFVAEVEKILKEKGIIKAQ